MATVEEVVERMRQAVGVVEAARLPEDLRAVGFEWALDALGLVPAVADAPRSVAAPTGGLDQSGGVSTPMPAGERLVQIGRRFELPVDLLERIYEEEGGQVRLAIKRSMLPEPDRRAAAMRDVALLVVAGRQAAGEELTELRIVREECRALNVLDGPNFASEVAKLDFRLTGPKHKREARANRHHFEEAAQLIRRILGETST